VSTAWNWPSNEQFASADVIVAFCYMPWTEARLATMRRYLANGGGLVLVHSATWTRPEPSTEVAEVVGVGGFQRYRHGPVPLTIAAPEHPICLGLPPVVTLQNDETYWPPTPLMDEATVLAQCSEADESAENSVAHPQPMLWCYPLEKGRVFGCVPGHCGATFDDPLFRILLLRGIAWSAGGSPYRLDCLVLRGSSPGSPQP
jgi:type 1 glutamine amidotransferase